MPMSFGESNSRGDPFRCDTWAGHDSLPRLNLHNSDARAHLLARPRLTMQFEDDGQPGRRRLRDLGFCRSWLAFAAASNPIFG